MSLARFAPFNDFVFVSIPRSKPTAQPRLELLPQPQPDVLQATVSSRCREQIIDAGGKSKSLLKQGQTVLIASNHFGKKFADHADCAEFIISADEILGVFR